MAVEAQPARDPIATIAPSPWIVRFAHLVSPGARVLDLACGSGRHTRFFAGHGAQVVAVDRDSQAIDSLAGIANVEARVLDLEAGEWPLAGERFDAVVVANYLHRPLLPSLLDALAADGAFLYETFARGNEAYGRPSNPAFLLAPGELLDVVRGRLTIVAFEQGLIERSDRSAVVQRVAAVGPGRHWPSTLP